MAKRERENRLRERREDKQAKKAARKRASQAPDASFEMEANGQVGAASRAPVPDNATEPRAED